MTQPNASAAANPAEVLTAETIIRKRDAALAYQQRVVEACVRAAAGARAKVDKYEALLAGCREALANAEDELADAEDELAAARAALEEMVS